MKGELQGVLAECIYSVISLWEIEVQNDKQVRCRYIDIDVQITRWSVGNPHTMEIAVPVLEVS